MNTEQKITELLKSTQRGNIEGLIGWLAISGFFTSPASMRFHGCYEGGLAEHSLNVYEALSELSEGLLRAPVPKDSIIIASLLHDLCKVGAYKHKGEKYVWNKQHPKGHAKLSLEIIKQLIEITPLEEMMIKYHMGIYGLVEFQDAGKEHKGEYTLRNKSMANAWFHHPIVKLMYFCDEIATLREKRRDD